MAHSLVGPALGGMCACEKMAQPVGACLSCSVQDLPVSDDIRVSSRIANEPKARLHVVISSIRMDASMKLICASALLLAIAASISAETSFNRNDMIRTRDMIGAVANNTNTDGSVVWNAEESFAAAHEDRD
jgi:hypothetical protein